MNKRVAWLAFAAISVSSASAQLPHRAPVNNADALDRQFEEECKGKYFGLNGVKDHKRALRMCRAPALNGNMEAALIAALIAENGTPDDPYAINLRAAEEYYGMLNAKGLPSGAEGLARIRQSRSQAITDLKAEAARQDLAGNTERAIELYDIAWSHGDDDSIMQLAQIYERKHEADPRNWEHLSWYKMAAAKGSREAQRWLIADENARKKRIAAQEAARAKAREEWKKLFAARRTPAARDPATKRRICVIDCNSNFYSTDFMFNQIQRTSCANRCNW